MMGIANTMMETYYEVKAELAKAIGERDQLAEKLAGLLDIWDERNTPEEFRSYVSGAFGDEMESLRALLK